MKAYAEELRQKIVQALGRGISKSQAARLFDVSLSAVKRYAREYPATGKPTRSEEGNRKTPEDR